MKRRVCIWKARKETRPKAIEELNDYLTIFMADTTAWQELGDLYLDEQKSLPSSALYPRKNSVLMVGCRYVFSPGMSMLRFATRSSSLRSP